LRMLSGEHSLQGMRASMEVNKRVNHSSSHSNIVKRERTEKEREREKREERERKHGNRMKASSWRAFPWKAM